MNIGRLEVNRYGSQGDKKRESAFLIVIGILIMNAFLFPIILIWLFNESIRVPLTITLFLNALSNYTERME